jgi:hypothetical protein
MRTSSKGWGSSPAVKSLGCEARSEAGESGSPVPAGWDDDETIGRIISSAVLWVVEPPSEFCSKSWMLDIRSCAARNLFCRYCRRTVPMLRMSKLSTALLLLELGT